MRGLPEHDQLGGGAADFFDEHLKDMYVKRAPGPRSGGVGGGGIEGGHTWGCDVPTGNTNPNRAIAPLRMSLSQASTRSSDGRTAEARSQVSSEGRAPSPMPGRPSSASQGSVSSGAEPRHRDRRTGRSPSREPRRSPSKERNRRVAPPPPPPVAPPMLSQLMMGMPTQPTSPVDDIPYRQSRDLREPETDASAWTPVARTGFCGIAPASGFTGCRTEAGTKPSSSNIVPHTEDRRCCRCVQVAESYFDHVCPKCRAIMCARCLEDFRLIINSYRCPSCGDEQANQEYLRHNLWLLGMYRSTHRTFSAIGESIGSFFTGSAASSGPGDASTTQSYSQQRRGLGAVCSGAPIASGNSSGEDEEPAIPEHSSQPPVVDWYPESLFTDGSGATSRGSGLLVETTPLITGVPPPPPPPPPAPPRSGTKQRGAESAGQQPPSPQDQSAKLNKQQHRL